MSYQYITLYNVDIAVVALKISFLCDLISETNFAVI